MMSKEDKPSTSKTYRFPKKSFQQMGRIQEGWRLVIKESATTRAIPRATARQDNQMISLVRPQRTYDST